MSDFADIAPGADVAGRLFNSRWINQVTRATNPSAREANRPRSPEPIFQLIIDVINDSGAAIDAEFPILRLTTPVVTVADNANAPYNAVDFKGDTPDADTKANFAVLQGPAPADRARPAVVIGATWCKVNILDAAHQFATSIDADDTKLESSTAGVRILWKETGTGDKWAIVLLGTAPGGMNVIHGLAVGAMSASTHTIDNVELINGADPRDDTTDAAETVAVENPFGYTTDDNGKIRAEQADNGDWIVTDAECPA